MHSPLPALRALTACLAAGLTVFAGIAAGQTLSHCVPGAATPGKTTEITIHGTKLDGPIRVWTSFAAQVEVVSGNPKGRASFVCKVTLPADAPVGVGGIVVSTINGVSDPLPLMIDDLPSVADVATNNAPAMAQEIALPAAIDGQSSGTVFDFYRFTAKAGQRLSLEVVAARLGSNFDPVLRLLDAAGNELAIVDDDISLGADCRLSHTFAADGQYTLELRDNAYKAGGRYRMRLGDFPLVSTPYPLGIREGSTTHVSAAGPLVDAGISTIVQAPAVVPGNQLLFSAKLPGGQSSGFATLVASDLPEAVEAVTADKPDEPTAITLPTAFSGRLEAPADNDQFQFPAVKGTRLTFRAVTRSVDSPALLVMRIQKVHDGAQLAESGQGPSEEETLSFVVPETGLYRLAVEDLLGRGGPEFTYRVEARCGATFNLVLKNDKAAKTKVTIPKNGGAFYLDVQCQRGGYDGPIALSLDTQRTGWQTFNSMIPAKANEVRMYVVAPPDLGEAEYVPLRIAGKAADGSCQHTATMSTLVQFRAARPHVPYPAGWIDGVVQVCGSDDQPAFYTLAADKSEVNFPRLVGQTQLTLTMDRTNDKFKDVPLTVLPLDLPVGITAEVKRNGNGPKETYDIILKGPKDLADAQRAFRYFAYAELAGAGRAFVSSDVRINAITPLAATIAVAEPLVAGQKQKAKITLVRRGDDKQPVEVKIKKLPTGVTGPEKISLTAEQNELEIELAAAADAMVGKFAELAVTATTKYSGQDISVESPAATLEVKAP